MLGRFVALLPLLLLAGCPKETPAPPAGFKVALVTPGPTTDMGWNALAWDGAQRIQKELGAQVSHQQQGDKEKFADVLKAFALDGANVVFAHGFEYQDACEQVGAKFPGTVFVIASGQRSFANGAPIDIKLDEAFYLAGILAAHLTKSKKLGCVGGMPIPVVKAGFAAFERAARKVDKEIAVTAAYLDSWDDAAKGKEQALALAAAGCDVMIHNADHAGLGVFAACKEKSLLAIGSNRDQNDVEPGVVIASATADIARCMLDLAREVKDGRFKPRDVVLDMKSGYVDLSLSPKVTIPSDVKKEIDAARTALVAGSLDPGKD
jgi:basic membrane lipoprotein Med (substrate-binding protein (PBP1-ABC) superfamily)